MVACKRRLHFFCSTNTFSTRKICTALRFVELRNDYDDNMPSGNKDTSMQHSLTTITENSNEMWVIRCLYGMYITLSILSNGWIICECLCPRFSGCYYWSEDPFLSGKNLSEIIFAFMDLFKNCVSIASKNSRIHFPLHSSSFSLFKYHWQTNWFRLNTIHIWCINNISNGVLAVVKSSYRGFVTWVFGAGYFLMHSKRGTAFNPTNDEGKRIILAWRWFFT